VTLAVDAIIVAGGLFFGRWISRALRRRGASEAPASPSEADEGRGEVADPLALFVCKLGDVVVRRFEGDEAWLESALVLAEEKPVAVLFVAPDAEGDRAVLVRSDADETLTWLRPLAAGQLGSFKDPPLAVEHLGVGFRRTRRLPVRVERLGNRAPDVGGHALLGEYAAPGVERLVVLVTAGDVLAWRGVSLSDGQYDILPGGKATLEA
jgi:hypothetical protein